MTVGVRGGSWREEHREKKRMKVSGEKITPIEVVRPGNAEANRIIFRINQPKPVVIKEYKRPKGEPYGAEVTVDEMIRRFKFQKELYSRGFPVARPIKILIKKDTIEWVEEKIRGPTVIDITDRLMEEGEYEKAKEIREKAWESWDKLNNYINPEGTLNSFFEKFEKGFDGSTRNAIWDPVKKKVIYTDLMTYRKKEKK